MFSFIRKLLTHRKPAKPRNRKPLAPPRQRLRHIERLEDRSMLSISDYLLEIDGVDGESTSNAPARIEIASFSFGTSNSGTPSTGAGRATVLDLVKAPTHKEPSGYLTYKLENVFVS